MSWIWPTLSGEDVGLSAAGYWLPIQGAARRNEGTISKHTASHQFCEIANQGGEVDMPRHGSLRLWFPLPFQNTAAMSTPMESNERTLQKKSLSPLAPAFEYAPKVKGLPQASIMVEESDCLPKSSLSPLAPVFVYAPRGRFKVPSENISVRPISLSPDAPPFVPAHSTPSIKQCKASTTAVMTHCQKGATIEKTVGKKSTLAKGSPGQNRQGLGHQPPPNKVRFAPQSILVKSVHIYPRTRIRDKASLYYSKSEIRQFRQEARCVGSRALQPH